MTWHGSYARQEIADCAGGVVNKAIQYTTSFRAAIPVSGLLLAISFYLILLATILPIVHLVLSAHGLLRRLVTRGLRN